MYSRQTNTCTRKKVEEEKKSITVGTTNNNHNSSHSYLHTIEKRKREKNIMKETIPNTVLDYLLNTATDDENRL
jgi:hypothetical protein